MHSNHPRPIYGCSWQRKPQITPVCRPYCCPWGLGTPVWAMTDQIQEHTSESGAWHSRRTSLTSDLRIYFWVPGVGKSLSIYPLMLHSTSLSTHNSTWLQAESLTWTPFLRSGPAAPVTGISSSTQNACLHNCQIGQIYQLSPLFPFQRCNLCILILLWNYKALNHKPPTGQYWCSVNDLEPGQFSQVWAVCTDQRGVSLTSFLEVQPDCFPWRP